MLGRRYSRRRPTLREGMTPRRAQSSTVDLGTRSRAATSPAVSTSAAVSGRPSGAFERGSRRARSAAGGSEASLNCPVRCG